MNLAYCTNIHPAETWQETLHALNTHVLAVRDLSIANGDHLPSLPYPIGLRLSALAAQELLQQENLPAFQDWLSENNSYVFTINGFPYGAFHGTRVKEQVFLPDWSSSLRLQYTKDLFKIIARIAPKTAGGSVSTLPASHKSFHPDPKAILSNLSEIAWHIEELSQQHQLDLHLGLEPEPLGYFENTSETLRFFKSLHSHAKSPSIISSRIGLNFDCCHFAVEFDSAIESLDTFADAGIRLSKIHLSNALAFEPADPEALSSIARFNEPTYFHQVIARRRDGSLERFADLPDFLSAIESKQLSPSAFNEARVHFHIPLDALPEPPLRSTSEHVIQTLDWCRSHPSMCGHFEIETYTWGVLPENLQRPVEEQIASEFHWVMDKLHHSHPS